MAILFRLLLIVLVFPAVLPRAAGQSLPKFPQQAHLATAAEVKAYWTRTLRWQCRTTRNRTFLDDKKRLTKRIELGLYDEEADLAAQRSNLAFLEFKERYVAAQKIRTRITLLEESLLQRRLVALAAAPAPPQPVGGPAPVPRPPAPEDAPPAPFPDPETIFVEVGDDGADCPPEEAPRTPEGRSRHSSRPHRPGSPHHPHLRSKPSSPSLPVRERQAPRPVAKHPTPTHPASAPPSHPASSPRPVAQPAPRPTPPSTPSSFPGSRYRR